MGKHKNRANRFERRGSKLSDAMLNEDMNALIDKALNFKEKGNTRQTKKMLDKIRGMGRNFEGLDLDQLLDDIYTHDADNPTYDPSDYTWGGAESNQFGGDTGFGQEGGTGAVGGSSLLGPGEEAPVTVDEPYVQPGSEDNFDTDIDSTTGELANAPGQYSDYSDTLPNFLDLSGDSSWKEIANMDQKAAWIEAQRRAAGQDAAANVQAQQLQGAQDLAAKDVMSNADVQRIMGGYAGQLADVEGRTMGAIQENMGARGMSPSSGVGAGMAGHASLQRQMGLAGAGNQLQTQQMTMNRSGLERAMGLQSNAASNLSNVLTGYGTQQWALPAADYWRTLQNSSWAEPDTKTDWGAYAVGQMGPGGSGYSAWANR